MAEEWRTSRRLLGWMRRHERRLIDAWLLGQLALVGVVIVWSLGFRGPDRAIAAWTSEWLSSVERCRELVDAGRYEEAAARIERLDARFPAVHNRHRLAESREELLRLLGWCYQELGRKRRCLETLGWLVEYQPRTWRNHFALALARRRFDEPAAAEEAYEAVLAIHPNHLPSVIDLATMHFDAGRFDRVVEVYEAYLDAFCTTVLTARFGDVVVAQRLRVDARPQLFDTPVDLPAGWKGDLCISSRGITLRMGRVELFGPLRVGLPGDRELVTVPTGSSSHWTIRDFERRDSELFLASGPDPRLCTAIEGPMAGTARLRAEITAYKTVTVELWRMVETSYRNRLDYAGLERARERSRVGGPPGVGWTFPDAKARSR